MKKKIVVSMMDLMVLSISLVFFITMAMSGEFLLMVVMGVFVLLSLKVYWISRKKYLYGYC